MRREVTSTTWAAAGCPCLGCQKLRIQEGIINDGEELGSSAERVKSIIESELEGYDEWWMKIRERQVGKERELLRLPALRIREEIEVMVRERERKEREWERRDRELQERFEGLVDEGRLLASDEERDRVRSNVEFSGDGSNVAEQTEEQNIFHFDTCGADHLEGSSNKQGKLKNENGV